MNSDKQEFFINGLEDLDSELLEEATLISTPAKNLSNKLDSILRSLENLAQKKARIEYEIKKQKSSLFRKREELKKVQKSYRKKARLSLESSDPIVAQSVQELQRFSKRCSQLLTESQRVLDQ